MALDRKSATPAERITLPTYALGFGYIGVNYLLNPPRLTESPSLANADSILTLPAWGLMYLGLSVLMLVAFAIRGVVPFSYALWIAAICEALWALCLFVGIWTADLSASAWTRDGMIAAFCYASLRMLQTREV